MKKSVTINLLSVRWFRRGKESSEMGKGRATDGRKMPLHYLSVYWFLRKIKGKKSKMGMKTMKQLSSCQHAGSGRLEATDGGGEIKKSLRRERGENKEEGIRGKQR